MMKTQLRQVRTNEAKQEATNVRLAITTAQEERNHIRSPQYSSYSVRLSTFARFRVAAGVDVHMIAAAGFYYTGYMDIVRCYACDGGFKEWAPGDDPWDEHYRWFPNCFYLKVSNYNPTRRTNKPEYSYRRSEEKPLIVVREAPALEVVARRQNELTIEKQKQKNVVAEPDLNTPAALAVLDFGYSRKAVKMAIQELRIKDFYCHLEENEKVTLKMILQAM